MKTILILVGMLFCAISTNAQFNQQLPNNLSEDWSSSPCLLVQNRNVQAVALSSTTITCTIVGIIADVNVRQVYVNHGVAPIEAVYVFPGSTRAAVYAMTMRVGKHIIRSVIGEKAQALREYSTAKAQGRSASLLEMLKPNIFSMNVANVRPGDSIVIDMHYTEAILLTNGVYEFVYPAVVAPRYVGAGQGDIAAALAKKDAPVEIPGKFTISVQLATGMLVKALYSPSHDLDVDYGNVFTKKNIKMNLVNHSIISISKYDSAKQNRDFILRYSLSGSTLESSFILYKGETENYFMLMAQPPRNVEISSVLPREFVFIVDVSSSMQGMPLTIANHLIESLLTTLRPEDKFNIMTFSGGSQVLADKSIEATSSNVSRGREFLVHNSQFGGSTELFPALKRALAMPSEEKCSRSFVVITDGFVEIEREVFKLVRENLNKANIYAFGIGNSVNRYLMEGLARAGNADPMIVTNINEAPMMAEKFKQYIDSPVLTKIKVDYGTLDVYDIEPVSIPDVTARRPVIVFGKWRGQPTGIVKLTGTTTDSTLDIEMNIGRSPIITAHSALKYLWARNKIMMMEDESNQRPTDTERKIITDIGLQYNLLTRYTSFVAVDSSTPVVTVKLQPRYSPRIATTAEGISSASEIRAMNKSATRNISGEYTTPNTSKHRSGTLSTTKTKKLSGKESIISPDKSTSKKPVTSVTKSEVNSINTSKDTTTQQLLEIDSLSVQSGLNIVEPNSYTFRGERSNETKMLVQGTEVSDQFSRGLPNNGISNTAATNSSNEVDSNAVAPNPSKAYPRIFVGISTTITTGWLSNYQPNGLTGNTLIGLTRESTFGYSTGLRLECLLGKVKYSTSFITADVMFGRMGFMYSTQDSVQSMNSQKMLGLYHLSTSASAFTLNVQYTQLIPGTFLGITAGVSTGYIFNVEHSYSVSASKAISPSVLLIGTSDSGRTVQYADFSARDINSLHLGLVAGLRYDIRLGRSALNIFSQVEYGLQVEYALNGILKGGNERPILLRTGVVWWFAF